MSEEELASKISGETPWWARAPVWLAAGIVGVPSLIALGAGYFIVQGVAGALRDNRIRADSAVTTIAAAKDRLDLYHTEDLRHWELVKKYMEAVLRTEQQACLQTAKTSQDRKDCIQVPDP